MTNKMRDEFENSPRFRGMNFTRSIQHPAFYESPYANGAWDGWQASREAVVIDLPKDLSMRLPQEVRDICVHWIEKEGLKVKP